MTDTVSINHVSHDYAAGIRTAIVVMEDKREKLIRNNPGNKLRWSQAVRPAIAAIDDMISTLRKEISE